MLKYTTLLPIALQERLEIQRSMDPLRYAARIYGAIAHDASRLVQTKTAYGVMILCGWIALAAMVPPVEHTAAEPGVPAQETAAAPVPVIPIPRAPEEVHAQVLPSSITIDLPYARNLKEPEPPAPPKPWNQRGVFLTPSSIGGQKYRDYTLNKLREVGGNAIIFDAKGSAVHFDAKNTPLAAELGLVKPWYNAKEIVDILHQNNVYAIARYIAVKDQSLAEALPETQLENPRTGRTVSDGWIDPADPQVLEYNRQIICELAASGVDEINLDYIRYDTRVGEIISAFTSEERISKIEAFVRMAREAIDACGPDTKLGVSTFAIIGWNYEKNVPYIGQDVVRFASMLDVISPMAYNANFRLDAYGDPTGKRGRWNYLVYRTLIGYAEELGPEHAWKLRPWLQGWGVGESELKMQIQGVFDAGMCGFLIWNADNAYEPAYDAFEELTIPDNCKGIGMQA